MQIFLEHGGFLTDLIFFPPANEFILKKEVRFREQQRKMIFCVYFLESKAWKVFKLDIWLVSRGSI